MQMTLRQFCRIVLADTALEPKTLATLVAILAAILCERVEWMEVEERLFQVGVVLSCLLRAFLFRTITAFPAF